jgi:hypothetical protein
MEGSNSPEFIGGPLYRLCCRRSCGQAFGSPVRRLVALVLVVWLPLLVLSALAGHAVGDRVRLPFLHDIEMQARLLVTLPLLMMAEGFVRARLRPITGQFIERKLVPPQDTARFEAAVTSARRLESSLAAEVAMLAAVYTVGVAVLWEVHPLELSNWHNGDDGRSGTTLAGWWMRWVSLPLVQFLLLRWYFRLFIHARFLWRVSRIELNLIPLHPDRCAGLGFLAMLGSAFIPVVLAQGALLAGMMANRVFYAGATLADFKIDVAGLMALILMAILGPMLVFFPRLAATKRAGLRYYGALAQRYVAAFDHKWLQRGPPERGELLGSADIQSLADLSNSFAVVAEMRPVPFSLRDVVQLGGLVLLPVAPLLLTLVPVDELLARLLKLLI